MDDVLLQQGVDTLVDLGERQLRGGTSARAAALLGQLHDQLAHNLEVAGLHALLVGGAALGQAVGFQHDARLLHELAGAVLVGGCQHVVDAAGDELASPCGGGRRHELGVVVAEHLIAANRQLLQELGVGGLADVHVAVVLLVALGVVAHGALEGVGDAHVVDYQAALFILVHAVHAGDGLHQVVAAHGLVNVHGGKARHVETGKPHVHHDDDLKRVGVVLEALGHLLDVGLVAHHVEPPLRVLVAHGHHDAQLALVLPGGSQLADALVDGHGRGARVGDDHRLAGQLVGSVSLVVVDDVIA